jgi:hypothetical protein
MSRMLLCMAQSLRPCGLQAKMVSSQSEAAVQNRTDRTDRALGELPMNTVRTPPLEVRSKL